MHLLCTIYSNTDNIYEIYRRIDKLVKREDFDYCDIVEIINIDNFNIKELENILKKYYGNDCIAKEIDRMLKKARKLKRKYIVLLDCHI